MGLVADILATYAGPRRVIRRQLAAGAREDRALMHLMLGCALVFIAQWPRLMRVAAEPGAPPFEALIGGALLAWLFIAPLGLYLLAGLSHALARLAGGKGTAFGARVALFWALLAAAPLWLVHGLARGYFGAAPVTQALGAIGLGVFLLFWFLGLIEAEAAEATETAQTAGDATRR
ncbi:MAG: YIP1 family protein [Alphaproteobacteria bacterium]|nr:MAG: YIP1 family protein [Alphaproteobacteria bacterium]